MSLMTCPKSHNWLGAEVEPKPRSYYSYSVLSFAIYYCWILLMEGIFHWPTDTKVITQQHPETIEKMAIWPESEGTHFFNEWNSNTQKALWDSILQILWVMIPSNIKLLRQYVWSCNHSEINLCESLAFYHLILDRYLL